MLELLDKDFNTAMTTLLHEIKVNSLEMDGKTNILAENITHKKEPNENFKADKHDLAETKS